MPCTNASGERSLSVLRRLKSYLGSTLAQDKTSSLALLCIESELIRQTDWSELIYKFVSMKVRKKLFC